MKIETIAIDQLSLDPANARKHGDRNIESIIGSLRRFGQQKPIVIDSSNVVRAGNGTLEAAKQLGWPEVQCVRTALKGSDAIAYAIADNRTAELAEWDDDVLTASLNGLLADDPDLLAATGFDEKELEALLEAAGKFDIDGQESPELATGDREPFQQMTFTLHDEQASSVKLAIEKSKEAGPFDSQNENSNGNALARIAEAYCGGS